MARQAGSSSSTPVSLATLNEKLAALGPNVTVKVSKGWVAAMLEAHDIDLSGDAPAESSAPAAGASRPNFTVS